VSDFCYGFPILNHVLAQAAHMDNVMATIGADPLLAIRRDHGASWFEARTRCIDCVMTRQCREWLMTAEGSTREEAPVFCSNHDFFLDCRSKAKGTLLAAA